MIGPAWGALICQWNHRVTRRAEYRLRAYECAETADRMSDPEDRLQLLKMAEVWMRLSEHIRDPEEPSRGDGERD
jgi:hypothetical protein